MAASAEDVRYMDRALELARRGAGRTSPNPMVGAVLVREGRVVGEGFHLYSEMKHAEILALEQAGDAARGATLYLNLEPCSHTGRTGPCTAAIQQAGVSRVVAGMQDPNPLVLGAGFQTLREAQIEVESGVREDACRFLNEHFARFIRRRIPFVTLKTAMTLDGKISATGPDHEWITGEESRAFVHRLRHAHDALLTGVGTIVADNPLLSDRSGLSRRRPLLRVVLDSSLRLPLDSQVATGASDDLLVVCGAGADPGRQRALESRRIRVLRAPEARPDLGWLFRELARREIMSVMIEAGAAINATALESDAIDKIVMLCAPKILGGADAIPSFGGRGMQSISAARPVRISALYRLGEDVAMEGYLHDVYGNY